MILVTMMMMTMNVILCTEARIFSWGKSSHGRLGREASTGDNAWPSLVSVDADDDDDSASRDIHVTSLCCSHSLSLVCVTQHTTGKC